MDDVRARQLVEQYSDALLRLACAWLGNVQDAQDVCQNTFIKALLHGRAFPDREQEKAWLLRIAINECKNHRKSAWVRHRADWSETSAVTVELPDPGGVWEAVELLPPKYRRVVVLRYYEGYEVKEIAKLLGQSAPLVSTHLARARSKLRDLLKEGSYETLI